MGERRIFGSSPPDESPTESRSSKKENEVLVNPYINGKIESDVTGEYKELPAGLRAIRVVVHSQAPSLNFRSVAIVIMASAEVGKVDSIVKYGGVTQIEVKGEYGQETVLVTPDAMAILDRENGQEEGEDDGAGYMRKAA